MAEPATRVWIATRKGLFAAERRAQGWQLQPAPSFLGEPVTMVLPDPRDGHLYAALRLGHFGVKLHRSADQGRTWQEIAAPAYPPKPADAPGAEPDKTPWSTDLVWSLVAGGPSQPGRLWAGTIPGGLFRSDDHGEHWSLVESLWQRPERAKWFGGGYDHAGIHSICVDPRDPRRLRLAVSCGGVWGSEDDGANWTLLGEGLCAEYMPPEAQDDLAIQDPHLMVRCAGAPDTLWIQHHNGVFVSHDDGRHWSAVKGIQPSDFGFAVAVHPQDPLTAWFAPAMKDQQRVPVDARLVVTRTRDGGRSFEALGQGLPQLSWDLIYRHGLVVDGSGRVLALASTTGGLWVSEDGGDRWQEVSSHLPPVYALRFE
jgi:hypothetical protein